MASPGGKDLFDVGDLVNNTYRIEAVLGRGGMGAVYLARHAVTEDQVAIKVLRAEHTNNEMQRELMIRERSVRAVQHDAVIGYHELGLTATSDIYLVMDYVEGKPLDSLMKDRAFSATEVLELGLHVARGLAACHEKKVIHRDLSPDNVLLRGGRVDQPVIIDFGIAKNTSTGETIIGPQFAGKYTFAPPEQFQGQVDARSDLYALGVTLLAVVRGSSPSFGANDFEIVANKQKPLDVSDVPEPLGSLLAVLTHPDPDQRPPTAEAAIRLFEAARAGPSTQSAPPAGLPEGTVIAPPLSQPPAFPAGAEPPTGDVDILDELGTTRIGSGLGGEPETQVWPPRPPQTQAQPSAPSQRRPIQPGPPSRPPQAPPAQPARARRAEPEPEPETEGGSSSGIVAAILAIAVLGAGGIYAWLNGYLDGLGGTSLEVRAPYRFEVALDQRGGVDVAGYAPSAEGASAIAGYLAETYSATAEAATLPVFAGAPTDRFVEDMGALLRELEPLEDFALRVEDAAGSVTGLAADRRTAESVASAIGAVAARGGYAIESDIAVGPRWLERQPLLDPISQAGGCGPLDVAAPIGERFTLGESVVVSGNVTDDAAKARVRQELEGRVGDRPLDLSGLVPINRPVCIVRALLPADAGSENIEIVFGFGSEEEERLNADGAYAVGENPLIDIVLPPGNDWGHLHVAAVDVKGKVFHLLPNQCGPATEILSLGKLDEGLRTIRVAHHTAEREQDACIIAFTVDEAFGKTLVLAFHTEVPLFDVPRPLSESAESFAAALKARADAGALDGIEIATRFIVSRQE